VTIIPRFSRSLAISPVNGPEINPYEVDVLGL
jgi:hypothetical protein